MVSMITRKVKMKEKSKGDVGESTTTSSEVSVLKTNNTADDGTGESADCDNNCKEEECNAADTDCSTKSSTKNEDGFDPSQPQVVTFPLQLMDLIEKETVDDNAAVIDDGQKAIEWLSAGDKFIIRDKFTVESCVLPKYFNKCKFMSFIRKLYRWGFRQVERDNSGKMIFSHKHFIRGNKRKCLEMRSIVKKPSAASIIGTSIHQPNAGDIMASYLLQSNRQVVYRSDMLSGIGGRSAFDMPIGGANYPGLPTTYGLGMQMQMPQSNYLSSRLDLLYQRPMYNMMSSAINSNSSDVPRPQEPSAAGMLWHLRQHDEAKFEPS